MTCILEFSLVIWDARLEIIFFFHILLHFFTFDGLCSIDVSL